jgi:hypothetical protein
MSGSQVMVIIVVAIVMVASIIRAGIRASSGQLHGKGAKRVERDDAVTQQLRDEVKTLKDRLAVIERITVEKENSLEREIESLRDR